MLTEEENKAIEYFKNYNWYADINTQHKNVDILLKLIEKLKKESEDLRVQGSIVYLDYKILKDKIREKLEELKNKEQELSDGQGYWGSSDLQAQIEILEDILEEE